MAPRLMGKESEYAFTAFGVGQQPLDRLAMLQRLFHLAAAHLPSVAGGAETDLYLQNGARLYIDCGAHPEYSTPECSSPFETVRHVLAGERILLGLAERLTRCQSEIEEAMFTKCNVCYHSRVATWGSHESYCHRADPRVLPSQIQSHLISRIVYTGGGGFDSLSPGLRFTLSPRAHHVVQEVSDQSTHARGIFHTKNETLNRNGYNRLHILLGENLCSQRAAVLKVGTTCLIVALAEHGIDLASGVQLRAPLEALRTIAEDETCAAEVEGANGRPLTAVSIQRHYLALVRAHLDEDWMPSWARRICELWEDTLVRLENGAPESVACMLDWAIKRALYEEAAQSRGLDWKTLRDTSPASVPPESTERRRRRRPSLFEFEGEMSADSLREQLMRLRRPRPSPAPSPQVEPVPQPGASNAMDCNRMLRIRPEMMEIDTRFGQLGERGIFAALDRAGVLEHALPEIADIETAMTEPPAVGRARLRGLAIRRVAMAGDHCVAAWEAVWNHTRQRVLDLSDPFETEEKWQDLHPSQSGDTASEPWRIRLRRRAVL